MAQLESIVHALQAKVVTLEGGSTSQPAPTPSNVATPSVVPSLSSRGISAAHGERGQPAEEEFALMLEDVAMSFGANTNRVRQQIDPNHRPADSHTPSAHPEVHHLHLVDPQRALILVNAFCQRLEWYTKVLHVPSFVDDVKDLLALSPEAAAGKSRPSFIACFLIVLCISLHLIEPDEELALGYTPEESSELARTLYAAVSSLLVNSDWLRRPSIEFLQCFVLMGVYAYNVDDEADCHWSLLGSAIKAAQNLGLSRLGCESESKQWPTAWRSFRRRETGRRVWWNLVYLDHSHAQAHQGTYCISPSQNHTALPTNVNDVDMNDDFVSWPADQHTDSTMSRFKIEFVTLYREFVDHLAEHQPPNYKFIIDMDASICKVVEHFPPAFTNPAALTPNARNPNLISEAVLIQITAANRHLRLHRPFLVRGYSEPALAASRDRCVASARSVLALLKIAKTSCPHIFKLWIVGFYSFVASIVLFIDLTHHSSHSSSDDTRTALRETVAFFRDCQHVSAAARNSVTLLQGLLDAEQEIAVVSQLGHPEKRRRLDTSDVDDNSFRRVVNRLLLQVTSSPQGRTGESPASSARSTAQIAPVGPWEFSSHLPLNITSSEDPASAAYFDEEYSGSLSAQDKDLSSLFSTDVDWGFMNMLSWDASSLN